MAARFCAVGILLSSCASAPLPHPTPDHPIRGCYITCASGRHFGFRGQNLCQGNRRFFDLTITGEEDIAGDPTESRWFTGLTSFGADYTVKERLKASDPTLQTGSAAWAVRYGEVLKEVQREFGDEARASYNKQDVVLSTCKTYIDRICAGIDKKCGTYPGEDQMGNSLPPK